MAGMMKGFMSGKGGFGGPGAGGPGGGGAGFKPADNAAKKTATPNGANTANANSLVDTSTGAQLPQEYWPKEIKDISQKLSSSFEARDHDE